VWSSPLTISHQLVSIRILTPESVDKVLRDVADVNFAIKSEPLLYNSGALCFYTLQFKTVYRKYGYKSSVSTL
jgi:hypothetical protein